MQIEGGILGNASVAKSLDNREIGVVELDVLADERDFDRWPWIAQLCTNCDQAVMSLS